VEAGTAAEGGSDRVDAAIAAFPDGVEYDPTVCMIGTIDGHHDATVQMPVSKYGPDIGICRGSGE
jgi:hypothetical protein